MVASTRFAPVDYRLDRVGEGELLVVVGVHAHFFSRRYSRTPCTSSPELDLFGVQRAVAVDDVEDAGRRLSDVLEHLVELQFVTVDTAIRLTVVS